MIVMLDDAYNPSLAVLEIEFTVADIRCRTVVEYPAGNWRDYSYSPVEPLDYADCADLGAVTQGEIVDAITDELRQQLVYGE